MRSRSGQSRKTAQRTAVTVSTCSGLVRGNGHLITARSVRRGNARGQCLQCRVGVDGRRDISCHCGRAKIGVDRPVSKCRARVRAVRARRYGAPTEDTRVIGGSHRQGRARSRHGCADDGVSCRGYGSAGARAGGDSAWLRWRQWPWSSCRSRRSRSKARCRVHAFVPALPPVTEPQLMTVAVLPVVVNVGELPRTLAVTVNVLVPTVCVAVTPELIGGRAGGAV